ncbi:hypothetical protein AVEN_167420-1 [Araneus ventricosus]|uniref:Uncharacterized protein n=1 Tax=Araneus ventricosus TaxID=182803 RepID=A0A4Y2K7B4_ARAVE|nr:hypothetical protein AVEN_167420-1 [Araneus ventricosus]
MIAIPLLQVVSNLWTRIDTSLKTKSTGDMTGKAEFMDTLDERESRTVINSLRELSIPIQLNPRVFSKEEETLALNKNFHQLRNIINYRESIYKIPAALRIEAEEYLSLIESQFKYLLSLIPNQSSGITKIDTSTQFSPVVSTNDVSIQLHLASDFEMNPNSQIETPTTDSGAFHSHPSRSTRSISGCKPPLSRDFLIPHNNGVSHSLNPFPSDVPVENPRKPTLLLYPATETSQDIQTLLNETLPATALKIHGLKPISKTV